jgi:hypothetical protein
MYSTNLMVYPLHSLEPLLLSFGSLGLYYFFQREPFEAVALSRA